MELPRRMLPLTGAPRLKTTKHFRFPPFSDSSSTLDDERKSSRGSASKSDLVDGLHGEDVGSDSVFSSDSETETATETEEDESDDNDDSEDSDGEDEDDEDEEEEEDEEDDDEEDEDEEDEDEDEEDEEDGDATSESESDSGSEGRMFLDSEAKEAKPIVRKLRPSSGGIKAPPSGDEGSDSPDTPEALRRATVTSRTAITKRKSRLRKPSEESSSDERGKRQKKGRGRHSSSESEEDAPRRKTRPRSRKLPSTSEEDDAPKADPSIPRRSRRLQRRAFTKTPPLTGNGAYNWPWLE